MSGINRAGLGVMFIAAMMMLGTALGADPIMALLCIGLAVVGMLAFASKEE